MRRLASFRARVGLIAAFGLALRLGYVFGPARHTKGIGDWYFFHWGANLIADGHWFVEPFEHVFHGRFVPSAGHPPLWELLLSGVSALGGTSYLAHRAVGCVIGAGTIVLIALLARRVAGGRRAADGGPDAGDRVADGEPGGAGDRRVDALRRGDRAGVAAAI